MEDPSIYDKPFALLVFLTMEDLKNLAPCSGELEIGWITTQLAEQGLHLGMAQANELPEGPWPWNREKFVPPNREWLCEYASTLIVNRALWYALSSGD